MSAQELLTAAIVVCEIAIAFLLVLPIVQGTIAALRDALQSSAPQTDFYSEIDALMQEVFAPAVETQLPPSAEMTETDADQDDLWSYPVESITPASPYYVPDERIFLLPAPRMTRTAINKMKKDRLVLELPTWGLDPADYRTAKDMKQALIAQAVAT